MPPPAPPVAVPPVPVPPDALLPPVPPLLVPPVAAVLPPCPTAPEPPIAPEAPLPWGPGLVVGSSFLAVQPRARVRGGTNQRAPRRRRRSMVVTWQLRGVGVRNTQISLRDAKHLLKKSNQGRPRAHK